jgi:hypothetical protein
VLVFFQAHVQKYCALRDWKPVAGFIVHGLCKNVVMEYSRVQ